MNDNREKYRSLLKLKIGGYVQIRLSVKRIHYVNYPKEKSSNLTVSIGIISKTALTVYTNPSRCTFPVVPTKGPRNSQIFYTKYKNAENMSGKPGFSDILLHRKA